MIAFRLPILTLSFSAYALAASHQEMVTADSPAAYWRFDDALDCCAQEAAFRHELKAEKTDVVSFVEPGPRGPKFPAFDAHNMAADFTAAGGPAFMRVKDPGAKSALDFAKGDTITVEAWVRCEGLKHGQHVCIAGKGRSAAGSTNQNWALCLRGARADGKPVACVSFLFRDEKNEGEGSWHRWTTARGFAPGEEWHHVAASYTFGKPDSAKAWINGVELDGKWDMGGPSELGPVQDDDELWIGGSMGGLADAQFPGRIDEVAIYRTALSTEKMCQRARREGPMPTLIAVAARRNPPSP